MKDFADVRKLAEQILEAADVDRATLPEHGSQELFFAYAQLALRKGKLVTDQDVHDTWARWAKTYEPQSRYIVPFEKLPEFIQAKDAPFAQAIRHVAAGLR